MQSIRPTVHAALHFAVPSVLLMSAAASPVAQVRQPFLLPNSLLISSTPYDRTRGAVAALTVGTTLPNTNTATTAAVVGNNYVEVWNNASVDGSFGVTSPIMLTDIEPHSGHVLSRLCVPTDQVVTSFSSKSELGLHLPSPSCPGATVRVAHWPQGQPSNPSSKIDGTGGASSSVLTIRL